MSDFFNYQEFIELAEDLVTFFGEGIASTVYTLGEAGQDMFGNPIGEAPVVINGLVTPLLDYAQSEIDGNTILSTDNFVFFHSDIEPEINMLHDSGGETYRIINIKKIDSVSGINTYRQLQLRK